jgi:hypothetical protein
MTDELAAKLQKRADGIDKWLHEIGSRCKSEQRHCDDGTVEREYWHYGYMMAIKDVLDDRGQAADVLKALERAKERLKE